MKSVHIIKRLFLVVIAIIMVMTSVFIPGVIVSATSTSVSKTSNGTSAPVKEEISFNDGWKFKKASDTDGTDYYSQNISDSSWSSVTLPHTWWKTGDGQTKETDTNIGWYRKHVTINNNMKNGQVWLEFEAAAHYTTVYVNGEKAAEHYGGYTTFRANITSFVKFGKENVITVETNSNLSLTPPIGGGFSKFPGITGDVSLIYTESIFAALDDYGSPGVFVTPEVTNKKKNIWNVSVDSTISNIGSAKDIKVKTVIRDMKTFEKVDGIDESFTPFDESTMYGNKVYHTVEKNVSLKKGNNKFSLDIEFKNPRLWNGRKDPYRYALDFEIYADGKLVDKVTQNFGFRYFEITKDGGFFLNGKSYPLRGVAYHEDFTGAGSAMTDEQWEESFKLIYELGGTFSRLSHYPHDPYSYELCDRYGIVVWTEIAIISGISFSGNQVHPLFEARAKDQLRELIRQNKNHPSVVVWGLENELDVGTNASRVSDTKRFMNELHDIAKKEDPTRLTTQTAGLHHNWAQWEVDVTAFNFYPMWYGEGNFEEEYKKHRDRMDKVAHFKNTALGFVEYGAGGGTLSHQHSEYPERPEKTTVKFHPQEWQNIVHEEAVKMINNHPELWVASLWCMFDFACDPFDEGDYSGTNDKGLVTRDRKTKKDVYYLYQANWLDAKTLPIIHFTSSSTSTREVAQNTVKVYSNLDSIELFRDGNSLGKMKNNGDGIFTMDNVDFGKIGETHTFVAKSGTQSATVKWKRVASENIEFDVNREQTYADAEKGTIGFSGNIEIKDINRIFTSKYNASFKVVKADGKTAVTSGMVEGGMKLIVTSESGKTKKEYVLLSSNIAAGKTVTASSHFGGKSPDKALDGYIDDAHQWNANESDSGKSWIMVDLGKTYTLNSTTLHLFKGHSNNRKYFYNIYVGKTEDDLISVVNRTSNKDVGTITDSLGGVKGRYVKIEFTGNSDYKAGNKSAVAGIYELEINGYNIIEGKAKFNHEDKIVTLPYEWEQNTNITNLLNDVKIEGNGFITIDTDQFYVMNGDKLIVNDFSGGKTTYTIMLGKDPNGKYEVSLPSNQQGYEIKASKNSFKYGSNITLSFKLKKGYEKDDDFAVIVNGKEIRLDEDGKHTFTNVTYDLIVSVEGVVKSDSADADDKTSTSSKNKKPTSSDDDDSTSSKNKKPTSSKDSDSTSSKNKKPTSSKDDGAFTSEETDSTDYIDDSSVPDDNDAIVSEDDEPIDSDTSEPTDSDDNIHTDADENEQAGTDDDDSQKSSSMLALIVGIVAAVLLVGGGVAAWLIYSKKKNQKNN